MGSINLGKLLVNTHTNAVANATSKTNQSQTTVEKDGFNKALSKAQQSTNSSDKQGTVQTKQDRATVKRTSKGNSIEETLEEEEVTGEEVVAAILDILSQELLMPVEEVTSTLEEMGLTPIDLLQEDKFSQFITALYNESTPEDLLMGNTQVKDISKVFTKIQEVSSQIVGNEIHKVLEETTKQGEVPIAKTQSVSAEEITRPMEETPIEEVVSSIWKPKEEKVETTAESATATGEHHMSHAQTLEHLGITVPITAFKSTVSLTNDQVQTNRMQEAIINPRLNLASQIVDHIEVTKLEQMQEIKMQLSPKELGQLTIKLVEKNGMLVADIKVESEKTKEFILSEISTLKESLEEQGINISNVQVDVRQNDSTTQMKQQQQKSSKRIQEIIEKHLQELEEEENQTVTLDIGESEVDYMV